MHLDRKKVTEENGRLYRDLFFLKQDLDTVKQTYEQRWEDWEWQVGTRTDMARNNTIALITILSKFY